MFSRGSGSSMATNKGKIMMELQDEQEGNNGLCIGNNKGNEILSEAQEEQELLEAMEALEMLQKGKEAVVETKEKQDGKDGPLLLLPAKEVPEWLQVLIRTEFWRECEVHRAVNCVFCVHCFKVICRCCRHGEDDPIHQLLKIRRYDYANVVSTRDMNRLGVDVSYIQAYKCNGHNVVHLLPIKRSPRHRARPGNPRCIICDCFLHTWPNHLCSLTCMHRFRREAEATNDLSGPRPSRRLARRGVQADVTSRHPYARGAVTSRPAE